METLRYVVLANGLLLIVSVAYYGLLRRETFFGANRLALWLGVVAALGLPLLTLPDWRPQRVKNVMYRTAQVIVPRVLPTPPPADVTITMPNGKTYPAFGGQLPAPVGWSWQQLLVVLYGLVALALLIRLMVQLLSLRRLINQSEHEPYSDFMLVRNPTVASPFSFFKWVVLNPDNHAPDELEQILRHERVHVRAWHSADMLGAEVLGIFFWFNPAVYLFRHLLHQTLEFTADRAVLNEGIDARSYQYNLVKVSLSGGRRIIGNTFSSSELKQRIGMMNRRGSGPSVWARYVLWAGMLGLMGLACRHKQDEQFSKNLTVNDKRLSATSPTRARVVALEDSGPWYQHLALYQTRSGTRLATSEPVVLTLKGNRFAIADGYTFAVAVYLDGKETPATSLSQIAPEFVREVFVMHQWDDQPGINTILKPYQILIQTSPKPLQFSGHRKQFFTLLQAASLSQHPHGDSHMSTMNSLLEATFFHNKNALVERSPNEHLKLYDEFTDNTVIFINRIPATAADVRTIHVREVARLHTRERPYTDWFRADNPFPRFELHIQTAPKRAKRDSTYYVFSPFYSGDF